MSMVTIQSPDGTERQSVFEDHLGAYPNWTIVADGAPEDDEANIVDGSWVVPFEIKQQRKWDRVKELRAEKKAEGTEILGVGMVQTDDTSTQNISDLVLRALIYESKNLAFS